MNRAGGPIICTIGASAGERRRYRRGVENREFTRLAPGHLVETSVLAELGEEERAAAVIVAHAGRAPTAVVVGLSAALLWGFPLTVGSGRGLVELGTRAGRRHRGSGVLNRALSEGHERHIVEMETRFGTVRVTDPVSTALDLARWSSFPDAVRALDAGLAEGLFTLEEIDRRVVAMSGLQGIDQVKRAALFASPGSESPRESDMKLLLHGLGLPPPLQQVKIFTRRGQWIGRVDFFYPEIGLVIEYDGQAKYGIHEGAAARKELQQTVTYLINGLCIVRIRKEHLRTGEASEIIGECHRHLTETGRPYPRDCWKGGVRAWRQSSASGISQKDP